MVITIWNITWREHNRKAIGLSTNKCSSLPTVVVDAVPTMIIRNVMRKMIALSVRMIPFEPMK